jgi:hypothetical protein
VDRSTDERRVVRAATAFAGELDAPDLGLAGEANAARAVQLGERDLVLADAELLRLEED